jgi:2,3-dihydroxyphenylpropionate 1,2-dioxygenase
VIVGAAAITHTPLSDRIRAPAEVERAFFAAVERAAQYAADWKPDLTVVFFADHFNGFHYNLMPAFCIGIQAESMGDWSTISGKIDVPEAMALDCATTCLKSGIDVCVSYQMRADHGYAQVVESLSAIRTLTKTIPVFINCAAPPRPSMARCRALGTVIGQWAKQLDARVLLVASGGLSHDPPTPVLSTASPEVRSRLIRGGELTHTERLERQKRVTRAGHEFVRGDSGSRALNPSWDQSFLEHLAQGQLDFADQSEDEQLTALAGSGSHEIRTWLAAWSAATVSGQLATQILFSQPIPEWITSCAVAIATGEQT